MKHALIFFAQLFFLIAIYQVSNYIVSFLELPVPASVLGMILLYLLMSNGIVKLKYIEVAASFLLKHLSLFFIPIAVGLMDYGGLIQTSGIQLIVVIAVSSMIGLFVTGGLTQLLARKKVQKEERYHEQSHSH
ncbi:CidA/LrgA family protein [Mesobacillus maritimus]|uniref:CidA/LrgA family protein n=1 Tax=Mesobacillus maritimus TaxID=1643336 RepID=UPI00384BE173